jgi:hypothetical protein
MSAGPQEYRTITAYPVVGPGEGPRATSPLAPAAGLDIKSACAASVDELTRGIDLLLERAKLAGAVRDDVETGAVMALIVGACHSKQDDLACQRMVEIVCDGIRRPTVAA